MGLEDQWHLKCNVNFIHAHGIKYLSVHLPNGLNGAVFGNRLSDNDNALLNLSGISAFLMQILDPILELGLFPSIYGDSVLPLTPTIQGYIRNPDFIEGIRNRWMNSCWMCIEHGYGQLFNLLRIMIHSESHQMLYNGVHIFRLGIPFFFYKIVMSTLMVSPPILLLTILLRRHPSQNIYL
jgi:hypothetical protein